MRNKLITPLLDGLNKKTMTSKKLYRIELKSVGGIANELATLAALSNGGKYISLKDMESIAKVECIKLPVTTEGISINLIGDNVLTIDRVTQNLLVLTEVEVLDVDCPTLTRQDAKDILEGLADDNHEHLLN